MTYKLKRNVCFTDSIRTVYRHSPEKYINLSKQDYIKMKQNKQYK